MHIAVRHTRTHHACMEPYSCSPSSLTPFSTTATFLSRKHALAVRDGAGTAPRTECAPQDTASQGLPTCIHSRQSQAEHSNTAHNGSSVDTVRVAAPAALPPLIEAASEHAHSGLEAQVGQLIGSHERPARLRAFTGVAQPVLSKAIRIRYKQMHVCSCMFSAGT